MNIAELQAIAVQLVKRSRKFAREMELDEHLSVDLDAEYGSLTRQHRVFFSRSCRPSRIDFRIGGTNPVLIELAVRPADGASQLYGSQNEPELQKLARFPQSQAKLRALLLIDLKNDPIPGSKLKNSYDCISLGAGRFQRNPVRILYVHDNLQYHCLWRA